MTDARIGFVSVVFEPEMPLQVLQARSFARHLDPKMVGSIVVIDNTALGLSRTVTRRMRHAYGPLADRVHVVRMKHLANMPGRHGWVRQQVAKLLASRMFDSDFYVALDAKNHLIRHVGREDFLTEEGHGRNGRHGYHDHPLRDRLGSTLAFLGASETQIDQAMDRFPTTTTPFVLSTALVAEILAEFGSDQAFAGDFERAGLLEFFLYSGWLEIRGDGFDSLYRDEPIQCPTVWPKAATPDGVAAAIARADEIDAPFFAVHRRSLAQAGDAAGSDLAAFWFSRNIFDSLQDAERLVRGFKRGYRRRLMIARGAERGAALLSKLIPTRDRRPAGNSEQR